MNTGLDEQARHYAVVAAAIDYIRQHAARQPVLDEIAAAVHMSPFHFQRLFSAWAGVSPKRFLQYLTKEHAKRELAGMGARTPDMLAVAAQVGLSSGSRLHDLMVSCEAMSPGEIKAGGAGLEIAYGMGPSPFGTALIAWTGRGICHLAFCSGDEAARLAELKAAWPQAGFVQREATALLDRVFSSPANDAPLRLLLRGTNFQIKVWEALIRIEPGHLRSYGELARQAAAPRAQRAVGSALAANTIAYLIPCHRVIRESGEPGNYRWGTERKLALQGWEAARTQAAPD